MKDKRCVICGSEDTFDIGLQFYRYVKCAVCSHQISQCHEYGATVQSKRYLKRLRTKTGSPAQDTSSVSVDVLQMVVGKNSQLIQGPYPDIINVLRGKYSLLAASQVLEYSFCPYSDVVKMMFFLNNKGRLVLDIKTNNDPRKTFFSRMQEFSTDSARVFAQNCDPECSITETATRSLIILSR